MWAIAQSVVIHNFKRSESLFIAIVSMVVIWFFTDPLLPLADIERGELFPNSLALFASIVLLFFVLLQELPKEMSCKFHLILLSKPLTRMDYLFGKIVGIYLFSWLYLLICLSFSYVSMMMQFDTEVPFESNWLKPLLHYSLYLWLLSVISALAGAFMGEAFCIIVIGITLVMSYVIGLIPSIIEREISFSASIFLKIIYYIVPNFMYFGPKNFENYSYSTLLYLAVYVVGYTGLILPIGIRRFNQLSFS